MSKTAIKGYDTDRQYIRRVSRGGKGPGPPIEIEKQKKKLSDFGPHLTNSWTRAWYIVVFRAWISFIHSFDK